MGRRVLPRSIPVCCAMTPWRPTRLGRARGIGRAAEASCPSDTLPQLSQRVGELRMDPARSMSTYPADSIFGTRSSGALSASATSMPAGTNCAPSAASACPGIRGTGRTPAVLACQISSDEKRFARMKLYNTPCAASISRGWSPLDHRGSGSTHDQVRSLASEAGEGRLVPAAAVVIGCCLSDGTAETATNLNFSKPALRELTKTGIAQAALVSMKSTCTAS
jgi:hypothetical protein